MKSDRERQEKLAKARLQARRNKRDQSKQSEEMKSDIEDLNDPSKLQVRGYIALPSSYLMNIFSSYFLILFSHFIFSSYFFIYLSFFYIHQPPNIKHSSPFQSSLLKGHSRQGEFLSTFLAMFFDFQVEYPSSSSRSAMSGPAASLISRPP